MSNGFESGFLLEKYSNRVVIPWLKEIFTILRYHSLIVNSDRDFLGEGVRCVANQYAWSLLLRRKLVECSWYHMGFYSLANFASELASNHYAILDSLRGVWRV